VTTRTIQRGKEKSIELYPNRQFGFIGNLDRQFGNGSVPTLTRTRSDGPEPLLTLPRRSAPEEGDNVIAAHDLDPHSGHSM
jgi:hypothetical protein